MRAVFRARWEVAREAVAVEVGRQRVGDKAPQLRVFQANGFRGLLLQARERVGFEKPPHAGQRAAEFGLHTGNDAAAFHARFRQRVGRCCDRQAEAAFELLQGRLHHTHRHRGGDELCELEPVPGTLLRRRAALLFSCGFPAHAEHIGRHLDRPVDFFRRARAEHHVLRRELERRARDVGAPCGCRRVRHALQRGPHLHLARRRVAQRQHRAELVNFAHQRRQAREQLQVLSDADAGAAAAELLRAGIGNRDELEARQRIVQRHLDHGLAVGVERDAWLPHQQRVEQLARAAAPATTARRHGFAAVVAAADDFALRGAGLHAPGALPDHRVQQVPRIVATQSEQAFVDGREGHVGAGHRLAFKQHLDARRGLLPHRVLGLVGADADLQLVRTDADLQGRHAELEGWLGEIDHRRRRLVLAPVVPIAAGPGEWLFPAPGEERIPGGVADAPAQCEHTHVDVRAPGLFDLQVDGRVVAAQRDHTR